MSTARPELEGLDKYKFGWADSDIAGATARRGLSHEVVEEISALKNEPEWMLKKRLKALEIFYKKPMPSWGADLSGIHFDNIKYFVRSTEKQAASWDELPADIKNTYDKLGIPEAEKQRLIAGVAAQYECLASETLVWTANRGQVRIKEIEPGDRVFALDEAIGRFVVAPVRAAAQTDVRQTYQVTVGGRTIRATDNHPFLVLSDERQPGRQRARFTRRWKTLAELAVGDLVAVPRGLPDFGDSCLLGGSDHARRKAPIGPLRTNPDLMWFFGLFVGDGSLQSSGRTHRVQLAIPAADRELRDEICRVVAEQFGLRVTEPDEFRVVINSRALVDFMIDAGFSGGAHSKRVPDWVNQLPCDERLAFLGGWVDADGYVKPEQSGSVVLTSVSVELLDAARSLAELCGLRAAGPWQWSEPYRHDASRTMTAYRLGISGDFERLGCRNVKRTERFGRRRYAQSATSARGTTFRVHTTDHLGFAKIKAIEPYGVEPVWDIEVDGPHNFIAEGMVVHNSEVVYHKIREDLEEQGVLFLDTDTALREQEDMFKEYFASVIPAGDNKFSALNTAVWSGGCLTADARLNVSGKGLVSIAQIEEGDEVFGVNLSNELVRGKVAAQVESGVKPVYKMRLAGRTLESTANHQFLVARRIVEGEQTRWVAVWVPLEEIEVGEPVAVARHLPDDGEAAALPEFREYIKNRSRMRGQAPIITDDDLMWFLGLYLGDGHVAAPQEHMRQISFAVPDDDPVYGEAIDVARRVFGIEHVTPTHCGFVISSKALGLWIHDLGFDGLAKSKRIPEWVYMLPHRQQLALLGGLVDADGWTERDGKSMCIELCQAELLEDVRQLAIACGLQADGQLTSRTRTTTFADGHEVTSTCWRLRIQGDLSRVGTRDPFKRGHVATKWRRNPYQAATGLNFSSLVTDTVGFAILREKTLVGEKPTFDIQVLGLENFVANGIVAHNSYIYVPPGVHVDIPLQAYFRINTENMGQFERTLIIADEGSYVHYVEGCLPAGSLVATAGGDWVPIESVRVGDQVLSHEGRAVRVSATQVRDHRGDLYTFTPLSPENEFSVTAEHPVLVVRRETVRTKRKERNGWKCEVDTRKLLAAEPEWVPAKDVVEGDFVVYPKARSTGAATPLPVDFARLAGYYLAEGSAQLINGCKALTFSFHIDEFELIEEVQQLCKELYDARGSVTRVPEKHSATVCVYTKAGYEAMRYHVGTGSSLKQLSPELMDQDDEFLANLVQTYVAGDGNRVARGGASWVRCHTTSRIWSRQLQAIMARLGTFATVELRRQGGPGEILGRAVMRKPLYQVQWTEGGRGPRQVRDAGDYFLVPVKRRSVTQFDGLVYNLDVAAPDSYVASGIAVHNCTAPVYSSDSLHSAVVEIVVKKNARVRYTTIQNWSNNVYNLVTKRTSVQAGGKMEWIDGNLGSKVTMKYPACFLLGENAVGETLSVAFAGEGQHQDAGAKMVHAAPNTSSNIVSKSVARGGGRTSYRGLVQVQPRATGSKATVKCDALLVDDISRSDTYPYVDVREDDSSIGHEASVSKVGEDQLFYLMQRGLSENEAMAMIVRGFIEPIARELPMEYALELNRLIELQMEGSVG